MLGDKLQSFISSCDSIVSTCKKINIFLIIIIIINFTWNDRKTGSYGRLASSDLVPHLGHDRGPRSNEPDASLDAGLGKVTSL